MPAYRESIRAPGAPEAVGPYVHAVRSGGDLLFCSGQIPLDPKTGDLVGATAADQAGRCLENLAAVCDAAGATLGDAVRLTARVEAGVEAEPRGALVEIDAVVALPD